MPIHLSELHQEDPPEIEWRLARTSHKSLFVRYTGRVYMGFPRIATREMTALITPLHLPDNEELFEVRKPQTRNIPELLFGRDLEIVARKHPYYLWYDRSTGWLYAAQVGALSDEWSPVFIEFYARRFYDLAIERAKRLLQARGTKLKGRGRWEYRIRCISYSYPNASDLQKLWELL